MYFSSVFFSLINLVFIEELRFAFGTGNHKDGEDIVITSSTRLRSRHVRQLESQASRFINVCRRAKNRKFEFLFDLGFQVGGANKYAQLSTGNRQ